MKCLSKNCENEVWTQSAFCDEHLTGLCGGGLRVDDLVPGLENAKKPVWTRIAKGRRMK